MLNFDFFYISRVYAMGGAHSNFSEKVKDLYKTLEAHISKSTSPFLCLQRLTFNDVFFLHMLSLNCPCLWQVCFEHNLDIDKDITQIKLPYVKGTVLFQCQITYKTTSWAQ